MFNKTAIHAAKFFDKFWLCCYSHHATIFYNEIKFIRDCFEEMFASCNTQPSVVTMKSITSVPVSPFLGILTFCIPPNGYCLPPICWLFDRWLRDGRRWYQNVRCRAGAWCSLYTLDVHRITSWILFLFSRIYVPLNFGTSQVITYC